MRAKTGDIIPRPGSSICQNPAEEREMARLLKKTGTKRRLKEELR